MFDRFVAAKALATPSATAFAIAEGEVTYAAMDADIDRVAARLPVAGLRPSEVVAVACANPYAHWLLVLALARLGVASMTAAPEARADLLLSDRDPDAALHVTPGWLADTLAAPRPAVQPASPAGGATGRILLSSGTTGTRKRTALSWDAILLRAPHYLLVGDMDLPHPRSLCMVGTDTVAGFMAGVNAWCTGRALVCARGLNMLAAELPALRPTALFLATGQLAALLDQLPAGFVPPSPLHVWIGGSPVSPALAARARSRLACDVWLLYGATECGGIAFGPDAVMARGPGAVGHVWPGQRVEVVDEAGAVLPPGQEGVIRVATHATGYDGEASPAFRDGWFYPGDAGRLMADGLLCVTGRLDEVLNLGGHKLLPFGVEDAARACPGVADAALVAAPGAGGYEAPHLVVVRGAGFDEATLRAAVTPALPGGLRPVLVWAGSIPRNAMAKIERKPLAERVRKAALLASGLGLGPPEQLEG